MLGLYVHIPFCGQLCHYCDFVKTIPKNQQVMSTYIDKLIMEINTYQKYFNKIDTIFIGGGTPNYLDNNNLEKLLQALKPINAKEFTIEINAEYYTSEQGKLFKKYGINRISIGAQSFDENILSYLNRNHKNQDVYFAVSDLKEKGLNNINIDLIFSIPNTNIETIKNDISTFLKLDVPHISYYSLILEENTYFHYLFNRNQYKEVDEDTSRNMFEYIIDTLPNYNYVHYEISNFAKPGYQSIHNKIYWHLDDYIGVGLGAHGLLNKVRYYNERSFNKYLKNTLYEKINLTEEDLLSEELIMRLRLSEGININLINQKYEIDLCNKFPKIKEMIELKLLTKKNGYLKLTKEGIFLGNQLFQIFI